MFMIEVRIIAQKSDPLIRYGGYSFQLEM